MRKNKIFSLIITLSVLIFNLNGQDYENMVLDLETGAITKYENVNPDSFPNTLTHNITTKFLTGLTDKEIAEKIIGTWIFNDVINHSGDTITNSVNMTFNSFELSKNNRFKVVATNSGDTLIGNYEINDRILKLIFDEPWNSLKGSDFGKWLPEETKKSFIYDNMIFSIHNLDNKSLSFVSHKQIGTYNGDIFNEIVFNVYKKND